MEFLTHLSLELPELRHGFFTRNGGRSNGIYASANCGPGSQDNGFAVQTNRDVVAHALGASPPNLLTCHQVHSPDVVSVDVPFDKRPRADALVTAAPGLLLGVLTADCAPVLLADPHARVIGAVHAGWKGAVGGVLGNTVAAMADLGADIASITAVIGPCIAQASYEVGADMRASFDEIAQQDCFAVGKSADKFQFDLPAFVTRQLSLAGVINVYSMGRDTYAEEKTFFSYRRACHREERGPDGSVDYGRQLSAIMLSEAA